MGNILFLSHTEDVGLSHHALETLTLASQIAADLGYDLVNGLYGGSTADALKQVTGKTFVVEGEENCVMPSNIPAFPRSREIFLIVGSPAIL